MWDVHAIAFFLHRSSGLFVSKKCAGGGRTGLSLRGISSFCFTSENLTAALIICCGATEEGIDMDDSLTNWQWYLAN